jgi:FkbM family methyltransferase
MTKVNLIENVNGRYLLPESDNCLRHGIESFDLMQYELRQFHSLLTIAKRLRSHRGVVDGGSNLGSWTIPLAIRHRDMCFHTFEVQRFIYHLACGSFALNGLDNVFANRCALSNGEGVRELCMPDYELSGNFGSFEVQTPFSNSDGELAKTPRTELVHFRTLDSFNIDPVLIKLDIEGMEHEALSGATNTIDVYEPIVWCENIKSDPAKILPIFLDRGYQLSGAIEKGWLFLPSWILEDGELHRALL